MTKQISRISVYDQLKKIHESLELLERGQQLWWNKQQANSVDETTEWWV